MTRQLTIIGASVRAAAQSALAAGFAPLAFDLFADRDLAAICRATRIERYPAEFLRVIQFAPQAPWIYTGGLENHPRLIERLAALRPLLGNRGPELVNVRDPSQLERAAEQAGCRFPRWQPQPNSAETQVQSGAWLLKPRRSGGGRSIRRVQPGGVDPRLCAARSAAYWQEYIAGQPASAVFVAARGRAMMLGATWQLVAGDFGLRNSFLYAGSIGPLDLPAIEVDRLTALGNLLAAQFGLCGLFNVDFIRSGGDLWVLEVNPRYSASIEVLERITGSPFVALHVAACERQQLPQETPLPASRYFGKAIAYADRDCAVSARFAALEAQLIRSVAWPAIADLPEIGQPVAAGEPIATVFAHGNDAEAVAGALRSRVEQVLQTMDPKI